MQAHQHRAGGSAREKVRRVLRESVPPKAHTAPAISRLVPSIALSVRGSSWSVVLLEQHYEARAFSFAVLRSHISRKRLKLYVSRILAGILLLSITTEAVQSPADDVIAFVLRLFAGASSQGSIKSEPGPVHVLGSERQLAGVELARFEELVEEFVLVGIGVAKARNESADFAFLDRDLDEFAFAQESVHAGVIVGCWRCGLRRSRKQG